MINYQKKSRHSIMQTKMTNEANIIRYKMHNILTKIILISMNRIILNIQLHELLQNPKSQHNFDTCTSQPDIGKKNKKKPKQNRGIKKDDANKILENNITVKLAITQNKEMGRICLFYLVQVDPLITSYCRYQLAAADFQFTLMQ